MNWLVFTITAYVVYALQILFGDTWQIKGHEPMLLLILLVYVALQAPALHAVWAALVLGIVMDVYTQDYAVGLIGPWAIGMLVAGYALVQMRNLLFKDSVFTVAMMTLIAGVFALLVSTTLYMLRDNIGLLGNQPVQAFSATGQLVHGFGALVYSAAIAMPMGYGLIKMGPLFGFSTRRSTR